MIATCFPASDDISVVANSPAILRLRLLEMQFAVAGPLPESQRKMTYDLIGALKRTIAEKPCLSFADVVAKLKTCDELARDDIGEMVDGAQKDIVRDALAEARGPFRALRPAA